MNLRPSNSEKWANCPASVGLKQAANKDTPASREGTLCHLITQYMSTGVIRPGDKATDINRNAEFNRHNNTGLVVTDELIDYAFTAAVYCSTASDIPGRWETPVSGGFLPPGVAGTADFIGYKKATRTLKLVDLKFGFVAVPAVDNWQTFIYSVGAYNILKAEGYPVDRFELDICQPRDYATGPFKTWELTFDEWTTILTDLHVRHARAISESTACTGPHCRFCKSRVFCSAWIATASGVLESVELDPENIELSPEALGAQYSYIIRAFDIITAAKKGYDDHITALIESGQPVRGWTVGPVGGKRYWSAPIEKIKAVEAMSGVKLTEEKPISITKADKLKKIAPLLKSLISQGRGYKKLIPFDGDKIKRLFNDK